MSERRSFPTDLIINGRPIHEIVIDPHYQSKHSDINQSNIGWFGVYGTTACLSAWLIVFGGKSL